MITETVAHRRAVKKFLNKKIAVKVSDIILEFLLVIVELKKDEYKEISITCRKKFVMDHLLYLLRMPRCAEFELF